MIPDITPKVDFNIGRRPDGPRWNSRRIRDLWLLSDDPITVAELASLAAIDLLELIQALREALREALALLREKDRAIDNLRERLSCRE